LLNINRSTKEPDYNKLKSQKENSKVNEAQFLID